MNILLKNDLFKVNNPLFDAKMEDIGKFCGKSKPSFYSGACMTSYASLS